MIYYMYGHGYRASKAKALRSPVTGPWLDLDICTLANKNDLEPLQQSAKNHFREWAEQAWSEPDFPSVVERIWDMEHLVSVQHMIEEVIADHAKDLCSPIGGSGDSLIKKVLCRKDLLKGSSFASCRGQKRRLRKVVRTLPIVHITRGQDSFGGRFAETSLYTDTSTSTHGREKRPRPY
jgi:hypothetical protein